MSARAAGSTTLRDSTTATTGSLAARPSSSTLSRGSCWTWRRRPSATPVMPRQTWQGSGSRFSWQRTAAPIPASSTCLPPTRRLIRSHIPAACTPMLRAVSPITSTCTGRRGDRHRLLIVPCGAARGTLENPARGKRSCPGRRLRARVGQAAATNGSSRWPRSRVGNRSLPAFRRGRRRRGIRGGWRIRGAQEAVPGT